MIFFKVFVYLILSNYDCNKKSLNDNLLMLSNKS